MTSPSQALIASGFILGLSFLVIPSFICFFMPENWTHHFSPDTLNASK